MSWAATESGYNSFQVLSSLHKDIRRWNEEQAMYWAIQLERYNYRMLWDRLEAIASEDIGLAKPFMPVIIRTLKEQYYEAAGHNGGSKKDSYRLFLANAILQLCRSKKSRLVDDFVWKVYWDHYNVVKHPIPPYAKLPHTCEGMNDKEFNDWYDATFQLENEDPDTSNPYNKQAKSNKKKYDKLLKKYPLKGRNSKDNKESE